MEQAERLERVTRGSTPLARRGSEPTWHVIWRQKWQLYIMLIPAFVLMFLFYLLPLWGISLAFVDYSPFKGVLGSAWVGLQNFTQFFTMRNAWPLFRNTLDIAVGKIVLGMIASVTFALILNEVRVKLFKRPVQTIVTLPHFMSWVIIGGIMVQLLSSKGAVNQLLAPLGLGSLRFLGDPNVFPWTLILSETWKEFGFGAIIYLAALANINPDLYEAAAVDGAGRSARLRHITLPGIAPTIILLSCLNLSNILNAGFEQVLVLLNPVVYSTGDILDTYVYRSGLLEHNYSMATAAGLIKSAISFFLILLSYWLADKLAHYRIF